MTRYSYWEYGPTGEMLITLTEEQIIQKFWEEYVSSEINLPYTHEGCIKYFKYKTWAFKTYG